MIPRGAVFVVATLLALGGCAGTRQPLPKWLGGSPPAPASSTEQFYAAADGVAVHAKASGSSPVVGRLSLHERVTRSDLVRGYAHVVADQSGLEGWVDNAKLLWRLPAPDAAAPPATMAPAADDASAAPAAPPQPTAAETQPAPAKSEVVKDFDPF